MNIKGVANLSLVDWDNEVCATLFLGGCNFRCGWCQNSSLVVDEQQINSIPIADILQHIEGLGSYITGICITGGEPTLHNIEPLCRDIKNLGLKVKLDTNGSHGEVAEKLLSDNLVDYLALDIKAPLTVKDYSKTTSTQISIDTLSTIMHLVDFLLNNKYDYEFRTTVVPTLHNKRSIEQICKYGITGARKYVIQNFWNCGNLIDPDLYKVKLFPQKKLVEFSKIAEQYVEEVKIRNFNQNL
jgi:pyruvate formate lyase activating enzyme